MTPPDHPPASQERKARHCPELIARSLEEERLDEQIEAFAKAVRKAWPERLAPLFPKTRISLSSDEGAEKPAKDLYEEVGPLAANFVLACGKDRLRALVSLDLRCALALTERCFGGSGEISPDEIAELPRSVGLVIENLALALGEALRIDANPLESCEILCRHENLGRLRPFGIEDRCVVWRFSIDREQGDGWPFLFALRASDLARFASDPGCSTRPAVPPAGAQARTVDIGAIAVPLHATLARFALPYSRLANLRVGDTIAVAPLREVPLICGERPIALGRVGKAGERVALQITSMR